MVIGTIIEQHADQSSFLWLLRDRSFSAPHYTLKNLAKLDSRVEAHIDGLRVAGDAGWEICKETLGAGESGEVFAAAVLAFERGDAARIQAVLEVADEKPETSRGLVSAIGWLTWQQAEVQVGKLLSDESPLFRCVGLAACAAHRQDPGKALIDALSDGHPIIRARALQSVGEQGRKDLLPYIQDTLTVEDDFCRYSAAWSAALLGSADSAFVLKSFVRSDFPWPEDALRLAMRRMDHASAIDWQTELARQANSTRLAIIAAGAIGDPVLIPWIIEQMTVPELARVAGESFTMITSVDIAYADLEGERPKGFESGPTEDPEDEDVEMDPDEDLPWPNPELVNTWWQKNKSGFRNGARYLLKHPITYEHMEH
ncbi:MAG: TIGR02270 family protein, partial [Desulfuromonadales bacterium]|nr:TIGR02270 family protein [Desulfuromonadales bacterium]